MPVVRLTTASLLESVLGMQDDVDVVTPPAAASIPLLPTPLPTAATPPLVDVTRASDATCRHASTMVDAVDGTASARAVDGEPSEALPMVGAATG